MHNAALFVAAATFLGPGGAAAPELAGKKRKEGKGRKGEEEFNRRKEKVIRAETKEMGIGEEFQKGNMKGREKGK